MILNLKKGDTVMYRKWTGSKKRTAKSQVLLTYDDFVLLKNGDRVAVLDLSGKKTTKKPRG